jgi:hypothetical protein
MLHCPHAECVRQSERQTDRRALLRLVSIKSVIKNKKERLQTAPDDPTCDARSKIKLMASKRYVGKTCPYCRVPNSTTTRDHVVAREFFLIEDRGDLPIVPACRACNQQKSALEHYALELMPLASRHPDAGQYNKKHLEPRLARKSELVIYTDGTWDNRRAARRVRYRENWWASFPARLLARQARRGSGGRSGSS